MKKRMYELAKTRRGLKKEKAHKRSVYGLSGVPGATRTPGLPLRRRSLCPTELREHGLWEVALGECTSSALGGGRSILLSYGNLLFGCVGWRVYLHYLRRRPLYPAEL